MRYLLASLSLFIIAPVQATESKDLAQLLKESQCVATRSKKGVISYKCDGTLAAELNAERNPNSSESELRTTQTLQANRKKQPISFSGHVKNQTNDEKIKSCLASIYNNQVDYYRTSGKYTTVSEDMGIDRNETCNGLYIYTNVANEREFKITAQFGRTVWTVDQTRTIQKLR